MYRSLFTRLLVVLFTFTGWHTTYAQQHPHKLAGLADAKPDKIRLRWSPATNVAWEMGNKYGYTVERFTISANGVLVSNPRPTLLTPQPLKPYTLQQMEAAAEKDERIAVVAEGIYSEDAKKVSPDKGLGAWFENQSQNDWRMAMTLLSCDLSVNAAKSAGLYLEDTDVKKGERYLYRIAVAKQPTNLVIDTAFISASVDEPTLLARPPELVIASADSAITLGWLTTFTRSMYSAYMIERAEDGKNFKPVSDLPVLPTAPDAAGFSYYQDSLPDNDTKFTYRLRGITPFGEYGPYSKTVEGIGTPTVSNRPIMDTIIVIDNKKVELRWQLPGDLPKQLTTLIVTRASNGKGPFLPIATFNKPVYTFTDPAPLGSNYYRIKGVTKSGKAIYSFPYFAQLIDSTPPAIPIGLAGRMDSTGIVTLQWDKNKEADLRGYRVFRANGEKEEFAEVTVDILLRPVFTDTITLHTLASKVYYKIIAVDKNYNTSAYSPPLILKRPDIIPPVPALFKKAFRSDSLHGIVLEWTNSPSHDVVKYTLFVINTADSIRKQIATWDTAQKRRQFLDTALRLGNTYYYELIAADEAGNQGKEVSGDVWYETGKRPPVTGLKGTADRDNKVIRLQWQYNQPNIKQFRIFRAKNDLPFTLYNTQDGNVNEWADKDILLGNVYRYKITAVMKGDVKAEMSRVVEVVF